MGDRLEWTFDLMKIGRTMPRQRYQTGRLFKKGTRRKQWYGRFYVYVLEEDGTERRRFKLEVLGAVSEMTKTDAQRKLQEIIDRDTSQPGAKPDPEIPWEDFIALSTAIAPAEPGRRGRNRRRVNCYKKHIMPAFEIRALIRSIAC